LSWAERLRNLVVAASLLYEIRRLLFLFRNTGRLIGQKLLTCVNGSLKFSKTNKRGLKAT